MEELHRGVYAATSQGPQAALLRTWEKFHQAWFSGCLDPYPLTANTIRAVSAMFRAGNYGSYRNYAFAAKGQHIRMGFQWSQQLDKILKDCIRSVNRGLGCSNRSEPIDLIKAVDTTWCWPLNDNHAGMPLDTTALILVACAFVCGEILLVPLSMNSVFTRRVTLAASDFLLQRRTLKHVVSLAQWNAGAT